MDSVPDLRFIRRMLWEKITLVGVGLLGGSLGLAIRENGLAKTVTGYVRRPASVGLCLGKNVVHHATTSLSEAVADAQLVILCTPIRQMLPLTREFLPHLRPGAILTDVGSVKACVVNDLESVSAAAGVHFVGSHPMAGAEKTGVDSARHDLFSQAVCALTPTTASHPESVARVEAFWKAVGAATLRLSPELHDELVGRCSHLPHVVAAALVNEILDPGLPAEQPRLCGSGFRDTTRIASGSPEMWRDICLANRDNLCRLLDALLGHLRAFREALANNETERVEEILRQAQTRRDHWITHHAPRTTSAATE